jgi:cysteine dioxygenase
MLTELIFSLRETPPRQRTEAEMLSLLAGAAEAYGRDRQPLVSRPDAYTRTCVYLDERFEVLLLNWSPGAYSALHDHGAEHCWMMVLEGRLLVDNYDRIDGCDVPRYAVVLPRDSRTLDIGDVDLGSSPANLHRVTAADSYGAVSLHVYARPLREFMIYDEFAQSCRPGTTHYDAVLPFLTEVRAS